MLLKRIEDEEQTLAYVDIQRTFQHKRQTLGKMVEYMKKRALMQKERIHQNQNKLREMAVYSKSSNLVIRKREAAANELMLSIYNPLYHKKKTDEDDYLIPVKDFDTEIEARSQKKYLFFDVVLNMKSVSRIKVSTADLVFSGVEHSEEKVTRELINLGELKLFSKLKQIYGAEKDSISLLEIENLANFKLVVSSTLESNVSRHEPSFNLIVEGSNTAPHLPLPR